MNELSLLSLAHFETQAHRLMALGHPGAGSLLRPARQAQLCALVSATVIVIQPWLNPGLDVSAAARLGLSGLTLLCGVGLMHGAEVEVRHRALTTKEAPDQTFTPAATRLWVGHDLAWNLSVAGALIATTLLIGSFVSFPVAALSGWILSGAALFSLPAAARAYAWIQASAVQLEGMRTEGAQLKKPRKQEAAQEGEAQEPA